MAVASWMTQIWPLLVGILTKIGGSKLGLFDKFENKEEDTPEDEEGGDSEEGGTDEGDSEGSGEEGSEEGGEEQESPKLDLSGLPEYQRIIALEEWYGGIDIEDVRGKDMYFSKDEEAKGEAIKETTKEIADDITGVLFDSGGAMAILKCVKDLLGLNIGGEIMNTIETSIKLAVQAKDAAGKLKATVESKDQIKKRIKGTADKMKKDLKEKVAGIIKGIVDEIKERVTNFLSAVTGLIEGTKDTVSRLASIPNSIIATTPSGPGLVTNMIPEMVQQLGAEGSRISEKVTEVKAAMDRLGLEEILSVIPGGNKVGTTLKAFKGAVDGTLETCNTICNMLGAVTNDIQSMVGELDTLTEETLEDIPEQPESEVDEDKIPTPELPFEIEIAAGDCKNYQGSATDTDKTTYKCFAAADSTSNLGYVPQEALPDKKYYVTNEEWLAAVDEYNKKWYPPASIFCKNCRNFKK